jgi:uncharacterized protein involved in type VI secretion and phage assembly
MTSSPKVYRGVIEDNDSPLKDGRVRVRIFGLHSDDKVLVPTSSLPWAEVMQSLAFGYGTGVGITSIPRKGTWVFLFLEEDNPNYPIVIGAVNGTPQKSSEYELPVSDRINQNDVNDLAIPGYPNDHVIETLAGHIIEIDDSLGNERIRIQHTNGNEVLLNNSGITVTSVKDRTEITAGKFLQTVLNTITINSTGAIQINTSESVNINSNGRTTVKANGDMNLSTAQVLNIESFSDTNIKVHGNTNVTTDGTTTVNSVGNMTAHTDGNLEVTAGGTATVNSVGNMTAHTDGNLAVTAGGTGNIKSTSGMTIQGSSVTIIGGSTMVI